MTRVTVHHTYATVTMSRYAAIEAIEDEILVNTALGIPIPQETLDTLTALKDPA